MVGLGGTWRHVGDDAHRAVPLMLPCLHSGQSLASQQLLNIELGHQLLFSLKTWSSSVVQAGRELSCLASLHCIGSHAPVQSYILF